MTDNELFERHVSVTDLAHGPFAIVVTDPENSNDDAYPMVVAPKGGYPTKEAALEYVSSFAARATPYLGLRFHVTQLSGENDFGVFCSWED